MVALNRIGHEINIHISINLPPLGRSAPTDPPPETGPSPAQPTSKAPEVEVPNACSLRR